MRIMPMSGQHTTTREALHQVAFFAVSPARYRADGRMGLGPTPGGFGTPEMGDGSVARVEGDTLVYEHKGDVATQKLATVRDAARFFGLDYQVDWFDGDFRDPPQAVDPDEPLPVDDNAARAVGDWFAFGFELLEKLATHAVEDDDVSTVQLWPEHFDAAVEMGSETGGKRASFGASPGDREHPEPYLYVAAWGEIDRSDGFWNDTAFNGSSLGHAELLAAQDPVELGLDFLLRGYGVLHTS